MFRFVSVLSLCVLLGGCAATTEARLDYVRQNYMTTANTDTNFSDKNNLDLLISADELFHNDDFSAADAAYEEFNHRNIDTTKGSFSREAATLLFGASVNEYKPYMMDALFVSYYQLWAALATGRYNDARVIINQSYSRQQDMSLAYKKTLESNQSSMIENAKLSEKLKSENSVWSVYTDIMNPALMYLSGIYFLNNSDWSDAKTYLSRAKGMVSDNSFVAKDLTLADRHEKPKNTVWVFIEDGFAPKLHEERVSLPVFMGGGMSIVTIAMSRPEFMNNFVHIDGAQELANVDAMFMTEYKEYRTNDSLRAFAAATGRTALQASMYNSRSSASSLMGLMSTIYSEITTSAEVRTWPTLPKTISVLRRDNDKSGLIELRSNGNLFENVKVSYDGSNYLVYVRIGPNNIDTKVIKLK